MSANIGGLSLLCNKFGIFGLSGGISVLPELKSFREMLEARQFQMAVLMFQRKPGE
jgi:hypothetical protein